MAEWHFEPDVIFETWTEEKFTLLLERRNRLVQRINRRESGEGEDEGIQSMEQLREAAKRREADAKNK